jgi:hypothetical protein
LCPTKARDSRQCGSTRGQMQKISAEKFHKTTVWSRNARAHRTEFMSTSLKCPLPLQPYLARR